MKKISEHRWMRLRQATLAAVFCAVMGVSGTILFAGTARADGVIIAPGVVIPSHENETKTGPGTDTSNVIRPEQGNGPGAAAQESGSGTDAGAAGNAESGASAGGANAATDGTTADVNMAAGPSGTATADTGDGGANTSGTGSTSAAAATDLDALLAQSLADPYTIFPTGDPNLVVSRGRTIDVTKPLLALTYDDGPQTSAGNRIMDVFDRYGQRATFFMVGDRVAARASEVQRMAAGGHEVANHTYSHTILTKVGAAEIQSQVTKCNNIIEQTCGIRPRIMRLPGGGKNSTVIANVGMPIILWNIDTLDWKHRNADTTVSAILGKVKHGDVVLMHELYEATADATERVVPQLVEQGFQLVTVSEMAAIKGISLENRVYYSF